MPFHMPRNHLQDLNLSSSTNCLLTAAMSLPYVIVQRIIPRVSLLISMSSSDCHMIHLTHNKDLVTSGVNVHGIHNSLSNHDACEKSTTRTIIITGSSTAGTITGEWRAIVMVRRPCCQDLVDQARMTPVGDFP